ncbi:MAG: hypothetical protein JWQ49_5002, partial [Edaphobacter sp.]|nr:hypothetical protein [Edaphobacter sp.]
MTLCNLAQLLNGNHETKKAARITASRLKKNPATTYFRAVLHYHRPHQLNGRVRNGNGCF